MPRLARRSVTSVNLEFDGARGRSTHGLGSLSAPNHKLLVRIPLPIYEEQRELLKEQIVNCAKGTDGLRI